PRLSRPAPDFMRSRRDSTRPWFRDFPTRRNSGARARHFGADRRSAKHRRLRRRRSIETIHPSLQFPPLQRGGHGGGACFQSNLFTLHYNSPPFSVGETGRTGGPGRREIGHGALAERSIEPIVPGENDFRYAIRISSEIMESNGSTSMASVCAGTLALMD